MNTQKLEEALVEMKRQRALLDAAITNLTDVLQTLKGGGQEEKPLSKGQRGGGSYIDLGVRVLEEAGKPMHITQIVEKISQIRGQDTPRGSVESSFIRHITNQAGHARLVKVKPAIFGLSIWGVLFSKENSAA